MLMNYDVIAVGNWLLFLRVLVWPATAAYLEIGSGKGYLPTTGCLGKSELDGSLRSGRA